MRNIVLKTTNLTKKYNNQYAIDNVCINIQKGDIYALVGQNGAGKSTLMRVIAALSNFDSGEISIFGEITKEGLSKARQRMGMIIEGPGLYPALTARENLEYYRIQRGIVDKKCVDNVLDIVGLENTGNKKFKNFSLGMKQRLGLALALLNSPDFLMLDEPINGLDPIGIVQIREVLKRMNEEGITILISSHLLPELSLLATRYGFIHQGKLIKELSVEELETECKVALHLQVNDVSKTVTILETELLISNYKVISATDIRIYDMNVSTSQIAKQLVQSGIEVDNISKVGDNIEDYYTNLIKEAN